MNLVPDFESPVCHGGRINLLSFSDHNRDDTVKTAYHILFTRPDCENIECSPVARKAVYRFRIHVDPKGYRRRIHGLAIGEHFETNCNDRVEYNRPKHYFHDHPANTHKDFFKLHRTIIRDLFLSRPFLHYFSIYYMFVNHIYISIVICQYSFIGPRQKAYISPSKVMRHLLSAF